MRYNHSTVEKIKSALVSSVAAVFVLGGMIWFGVWYFHFSTGEVEKVVLSSGQLPADGVAKNAAGETTAPIVASGRFDSAACGLAFSYPSAWQSNTAASVPLYGRPLAATVFSENYQNKQRVVAWFACFDSARYELGDIIGSEMTVSDLNIADTVSAGGIEWKRTPEFLYALANGRHLFLQVNFAKYDQNADAEHERMLTDILGSIKYK
jgi:hypothetical protein